ncbi:MAG: FAD-dependent oxidoreductase [Lactobacillaceae bacterium]|jgi:NADPH-dependent 2,4-dienoyl-CoA reductase/sulfur reductase-like enzyme|nr:FAD-dependent oxidoreductase [Lactobacillaceae bacterium]
MKLLVIGGSHAGFSAVNAFRSINADAEVLILEKNVTSHPFISAGIKLALNGALKNAEEVNFEHFEGQPNSEFRQGVIVERVDAENKKVYGHVLADGSAFEEPYDKLVYALGSSPRVPAFVGANLDRVVFVKDEQDAEEINHLVKGFGKKHALVYGGGPVGVELAAALIHYGSKVTYVTRSENLMQRYFDKPIQLDLEEQLTKHGVNLRKKQEVEFVEEAGKKITVHFNDNTEEVFDFMAIASGLQPNTMLLAGQVDMNPKGAILVNEQMQSSNPDIYVVGDAGVINGKHDQYFPLMSAALKMGRVAGYALAGLDVHILPLLRTMGFTVFDRYYYKTGLNARTAEKIEGWNSTMIELKTPATISTITGDKDIHAVLIYDDTVGTVRGAQIATDAPAASEIIATLANATSARLTVEELAFLDTYFESELNLPYSAANRLGEIGMIERATHRGEFNVVDDSYVGKRFTK